MIIAHLIIIIIITIIIIIIIINYNHFHYDTSYNHSLVPLALTKLLFLADASFNSGAWVQAKVPHNYLTWITAPTEATIQLYQRQLPYHHSPEAKAKCQIRSEYPRDQD